MTLTSGTLDTHTSPSQRHHQPLPPQHSSLLLSPPLPPTKPPGLLKCLPYCPGAARSPAVARPITICPSQSVPRPAFWSSRFALSSWTQLDVLPFFNVLSLPSTLLDSRIERKSHLRLFSPHRLPPSCLPAAFSPLFLPRDDQTRCVQTLRGIKPASPGPLRPR